MELEEEPLYKGDTENADRLGARPLCGFIRLAKRNSGPGMEGWLSG